MNSLPPGYENLEAYVADWNLPDSRARSGKRATTSYVAIKAFYDAILPLAPAALADLANLELGALDERQERLLKLLLSLAEIGPAVEWYEQPSVIDGFTAARFPLQNFIPDNVAQEYR